MIAPFVRASYSATFVDFPTTANVGDNFVAKVQVTNSTGTGSGSASVTISYDSNYFSTTDSATKTCSFGGTSVCSVTWSFTAIKSGTKSMSATATIGSDTADATSPNMVITSPTSYTLTFTDDDADNVLSSGQTVTLTLIVKNNGAAADATATLSLTGFTLSSGSASVSLGTINEGATATTTWMVTHDGSTTSPSATVTVTGGDTKSSSISFSYSTGATTTTTSPGSVAATTTTTTLLTTTTTTIPREQETHSVSSVAAGANATFTFTKSDTLKIQEIVINVKTALTSISATVKESSLPSGASAPVSAAAGAVYKYIEIVKGGYYTDQDINKAYIKFKVDKPWLSSNGIDKNTIALYRYYMEAWEKLSTQLLSEDADYVYYQAESTGLSVFAIAGEKLAATTTTLPTTTTTTVPPTVPETIGGMPTWTIAVIIVAAVGAVLIIFAFKKGFIKFGKKAPWSELYKNYK